MKPTGSDPSDNNNVISLFERHRHGELSHSAGDQQGELIETPDGFHYVSIREELPEATNDSHPQAEPNHLEIAYKKHYIFKFVEHHKDYQRVDSYSVPGEQLLTFINNISCRPGQLVEIQQFIPDTLG